MKVRVNNSYNPNSLCNIPLGNEFNGKFTINCKEDEVLVDYGRAFVAMKLSDCELVEYNDIEDAVKPPIVLSTKQKEFISSIEKSKEEKSLNFEEIMKALGEGKKITRKHFSFIYQPHYPRIKVIYSTNGYGKQEVYIDDGEYPKFNPINIPEVKDLMSISIVGYGSGKTVKVEYIYANPQMNRIIAHLENGKEVDYKIDLFSIQQGGVVLYKDPTKVKSDGLIEMTVKEIEERLGYKISIVESNE